MIGVGTFVTTPKMQEYVNDVLVTNRLSYGPYCKRFEQEFAFIHERAFGVLSNSGTSSLLVALETLKEVHEWDSNTCVAVPSITFVATINIVLQAGLKPVLIDVDTSYYTMDTTRLEDALQSNPSIKCVIPVHPFGQPANMIRIMALAKEYDLKVIEDSCECMFATHKGKRIGSYGDIACFSTYVAHLITTGVGGIAITDNPEYARIMRSLVNHGRDGIYISIDDGRNEKGEALKEIISKRFSFERIGYSFRITELEAALGVAQLETWEEMIAKRQANAARLSAILKPYRRSLQPATIRPLTTHSFMMYPIVVRNGNKGPLCQFLEEHGIETREMLPITNQPVYQEWIDPIDYPVAHWINNGGFYIGCHQDLTEADLNHIEATFALWFSKSER